MDGVDDAGVRRDAAGKIVGVSGFGNLNGYKARLVLQSVADVTPQEVDFSKTDPITKSDSPSDMPDQTALNAIEAAHKAALAFPGNPAGAQIERAVIRVVQVDDDGRPHGAATEEAPAATASRP